MKRMNEKREAYYRTFVLKSISRKNYFSYGLDTFFHLRNHYHKFYTDKYFKIKYKRQGILHVYYQFRNFRKRKNLWNEMLSQW